MARTVTARARLSRVTPLHRRTVDGDDLVVDEVALEFHADYSDNRNAAWARATPALSVHMTVLPEVAADFTAGAAYTLTFTPAEA